MKQTPSDISNSDDYSFVANVTNTTYTYTDDIISGATYSFKVRARSEVGYGPYSSAIRIIAASAPAVPNAPSTTLNEDTQEVKIQWNPPEDDGG